MFVYTVKSNTLKLFGCIAAALVIFGALLIFIPSDPTLSVYAEGGKIVYTEVKDNKSRVNFLSQFGWTVNEAPLEETKVTVPSEFDTVFAGYNELQKLQGLDLSKYKRKEITRYTYEITNYDGYDGKVLANLLVYRGRVIGGDICTESSDGFIHGFMKTTHL
ncbi:MAG: DUF4830 domain-containing protein [Clostridia bacterium]|nr:DUF4830 domain-containing protein [Clostridia bacterium]